MATYFADLLPVMAEQLSSGGEVRFRPRGTSMLPFLMEGRDEVVLVSPPERLKKGDIPFYRRDDGAFVLHRVVGLESGGLYSLCGDNQYYRERGVRPDQIIAVVKAVYRKGRYIPASSAAYRLRGALWPPAKRIISLPKRAYHKLERIFHK